MFTGEQFAKLAMDEKYNKYSYDQLDCQAFVEKVLADLGVRKIDGTIYNWRGSNSMYRNYVYWRGTKEEAIEKFGCIPVGAFVFVWADDGGEVERGYHDGLGNAKHVGIYCGGSLVRDSTRYKSHGEYIRNGVGDADIKSFNRVVLPIMLDCTGESGYDKDVTELLNLITEMRAKLDRMEGLVNDISRS